MIKKNIMLVFILIYSLIYGAVLLINGAVILDTNLLLENGAVYSVKIWNGEWWRLIAHLFINDTPVKYAINIILLYIIWSKYHKIFSPLIGIYILFTSAIFGALIQSINEPQIVLSGITGGILGLLSALIGWSMSRQQVSLNFRLKVLKLPLCSILILIIGSIILDNVPQFQFLGSSSLGLFLGISLTSNTEKEHKIITYISLIFLTIGSFVLITLMYIYSAGPNKLAILENHINTIYEIKENDRKIENEINRIYSKLKDQNAQIDINNLIAVAYNNNKLSNIKKEKEDKYYNKLKMIQYYTELRIKELQLLEKSLKLNEVDLAKKNLISIRYEMINLKKLINE